MAALASACFTLSVTASCESAGLECQTAKPIAIAATTNTLWIGLVRVIINSISFAHSVSHGAINL
jgi:hypothetical protein